MADLTNEGIEAGNAFTAANRKAVAFNALSKAYGPEVAYDPVAARQAQEYKQSEITNPIAAQQAQANLESTQLTNKDTAGTQQRLAAYRATQMLKSAAGPDGTIPQDAYNKIVRPNASLLGIDPDHIDQFGQMLAQPGGSQHLDTIAQSLIGPTKIAGSTTYGQDENGNFMLGRDQYGKPVKQYFEGQVVQQQRAATGQQNADTGVFRAQTGRINAGTAQARESVYAANQPFGPENPVSGMAPAAGGAPAAGAKPLTPAQANPTALFNRLPPKGKQAAISAATSIVNTGTNLANTNQILGTVLKQISPYTAGSGSLLKDLPGTQQADLKANLATLKAQGLMSWINSLKNQNGQTGIGRVLQSEANAATNLYGNMEQDQSAKQLAFHATLFKQTVNKLYQHSNQAFKAMYGVAPHEAIGSEEPNVSGTPLPTGWKYLGPAK